LTFFVLLCGSITLIRLFYKSVAVPLIYPLLKKLILRIMRRKSNLLKATDKGKCDESTNKRWVLVYGACTQLGRTVAKVFANYNYGLILVDANLSKL
jgi:hypothetical protein